MMLSMVLFLTIRISFFGWVSVQIFTHFLWDCSRGLCLFLGPNPLSDMSFANTSLPDCGLSFDFLNKIFKNQFSSVSQSCPILCDPMDCSTPGLPVHHQPPEFTQTHVHWVSDAIWPSHPLSSHSPPALNLSEHQGLFKWVSSLHKVAKGLEFQLQHQSFQLIFRTDFL